MSEIMHKRKKLGRWLFLLIALFVWIPRAAASEGLNYFVVEQSSETLYIALASQPVITYSDDVLHIVASASESYDVEVGNISQCVFSVSGQTVPTSIAKIVSEGPAVRSGMLFFDGLQPGSVVQLLTADGQVVSQSKVTADGQAVVSLNQHPKGAYVVKTSTQTFKIMNRGN